MTWTNSYLIQSIKTPFHSIDHDNMLLMFVYKIRHNVFLPYSVLCKLPPPFINLKEMNYCFVQTFGKKSYVTMRRTLYHVF